MTIFKFLDKTYKSKSEATDFYLEMFLKQGVFELTQEQKSILHALHALNPSYTIDAEDYKLELNKYNQVEIMELAGGKWFPFSIKRCIVGKGRTPIAQINKAFREAVSNQLWDFKKSKADCACQLCKSTESIQVDHLEPVFHTLVSNYIESKPDFELTDESIADFQTYHSTNAKLRLLCEKCNLDEYTKRGRKKFQTTESREEWVKNYHKRRYEERKKTKSV